MLPALPVPGSALLPPVSNAIYARLQADARQAAATAAAKGPGGQPGNDSDSSAAGSHPGNRLLDCPTADRPRTAGVRPLRADPPRGPNRNLEAAAIWISEATYSMSRIVSPTASVGVIRRG
jgi:hypothetical protein